MRTQAENTLIPFCAVTKSDLYLLLILIPEEQETVDAVHARPVTCRQSVYMRKSAKSRDLGTSAAEQWSDATDGAGNPADEAREDLSAIKMIGPSTQNRKVVL